MVKVLAEQNAFADATFPDDNEQPPAPRAIVKD
jgi:hypothetical protein